MQTRIDTTSPPQQPHWFQNLVQRLEAHRSPVADDRETGLRGEFDGIRRRLDRLSADVAVMAQDPRLARAAFRPLRQLAESSSSLERLLADELQRLDRPGQPVLSSEVVHTTLDELQSLHVRLQRQFLLVDRTAECAQRLQEILNELIAARWASAAHIQNLARRIVLQCRDADHALDLLPEPGFRIEDTLDESLSPLHRTILSCAIQGARLAAWTTGRLIGWDDRQELLTLAALVRDVGVFVLAAARRPRELGGESRNELLTDRRHPSIGAATVAGWKELAVALPPLVAQHHERCDGTGYPQGLRSHVQSAEQRLLALIDRCVELTNGGMELSTGYGDVARGLFREAERGEFDPALTRKFLGTLGFDAVDPDRAASSPAHELAEFHEAIAGPHFLTDVRTATQGSRQTSRVGV